MPSHSHRLTNPTVVFVEPGQVALEDRAVPLLASDDVLIKTSRSLISTGTELAALAGQVPSVSFPFAPGYSNVGRVVEVGDTASSAWIGAPVATNSPHARYVVAKESTLRPIPAVLTNDEHAAFFAIAEIVLNGIRRSHLEFGESAVVFGLGLLGQLLVRLCRLSGIRPVVAVDVSDARLALLPNDPGILPVRGDRDDLAVATMRSNHGRLADVVFDVTGAYSAIVGEFGCLKPEGRFVQLGSPRGTPSPFDLYTHCHAPSLTIIGAHYMSHPAHATPANPWTMARHAELFFDLVCAGELDLAPLVTRRAPFSDATAVYSGLTKDATQDLGVVLHWDGEGAS